MSANIRVMISSRCKDVFSAVENVSLSDIRRELKKEIESATLLGKIVFEVWINEEVPPKGGTWDSWDVCLRAVSECDILIVIFNGHAGWAKDSGGIGICHAEFMTGLSTAPGKVRLITLDPVKTKKRDERHRNKRFQEEVASQNLFRGGDVKTVGDLKARVLEAVYEAVISLAQSGVREASKGKFHSGAALDWSRLDFSSRQAEMVKVLRSTLKAMPNSDEVDQYVSLQLSDKPVLFVPSAIPAAVTIAAAREMVGQPFLRDYELSSAIHKHGNVGPVHLIACHRTMTEAQALRFLGFPDATVVSGPFGIYVADDIQKIQLIFIANCRDEATTRHGVQRFFDWITQTGEFDRLAARAQSRTSIVSVIASENAGRSQKSTGIARVSRGRRG